MNTVRTSGKSIGDGLASIWRSLGLGRGPNRGAAWGVMILGALLAFEIFNFSTTEFALQDVLGDLAFAGLALGDRPGNRILQHRFRRDCTNIHSPAGRR